MSTKLEISITKEILERSKYCGGYEVGRNCAIACAIVDIFPNAWVGADSITFGKMELIGDTKAFIANSSLGKIDLPIEAQSFIEQFDWLGVDERVLMQPISFNIEIPDEIVERINIEELKPLLANHPTLKLEEVEC